MCPGKKDCLSIKDPNTGKREHQQKRLLYLTLSEAHQLFCEECMDTIGFTKFTEQRPPYVRPMMSHIQSVHVQLSSKHRIQHQWVRCCETPKRLSYYQWASHNGKTVDSR